MAGSASMASRLATAGIANSRAKAWRLSSERLVAATIFSRSDFAAARASTRAQRPSPTIPTLTISTPIAFPSADCPQSGRVGSKDGRIRACNRPSGRSRHASTNRTRHHHDRYRRHLQRLGTSKYAAGEEELQLLRLDEGTIFRSRDGDRPGQDDLSR